MLKGFPVFILAGNTKKNQTNNYFCYIKMWTVVICSVLPLKFQKATDISEEGLTHICENVCFLNYISYHTIHH